MNKQVEICRRSDMDQMAMKREFKMISEKNREFFEGRGDVGRSSLWRQSSGPSGLNHWWSLSIYGFLVALF